MSRALAASFAVAGVIAARAPMVRADPAPDPQPDADAMTDRDRELHAALILAMSVVYLGVEFGFKSELASAECRWCNPPGYDASIRNALVWKNTNLASAISTGTGYAAAPIVASGLLIASTWQRKDWRRWFDDISPVLESAIAVSLLQHVSKFAVAQQRPFVHYAPPGTHVPNDDDNTSFWSGHTSLTFALTVSAGEVADDRGYALAPAIWASGVVLAGVTGYLRIAADKHYATDVVVGAAMGSLVGYAWPKLFHRDLVAHGLVVSPTPNGLALGGSF